MTRPSVPVNQPSFGPNMVSLAQMRSGQRGRIVRIDGGYGMARKLDALGIRVGKEIKKISDQWMRGPVFFQQDNTQAAIGFGMACRLLVDVSEEAG